MADNLDIVVSVVDKASAAAAKIGDSIGGIANKSALAGAAILSATGLMMKSVAKTAIEWESSFAGVRKTIDATEEQYKALEKGILNLSKTNPIDPNQLAKIAELGGQLGVAKENVIDFTDTISKIAITTNLTEESAASSFARIANIMQLTQDQFDEMGSALVDLGNNSATTEAEITEFANRIAGAGHIAEMSVSDVLGIATAFSSVGIQAEAGGSAVQKTILQMNNAVAAGGQEMADFADVAGLSATEFKKLWQTDAAKGFQLFVEGLQKQGDNASMTLGNLVGEDVRLQRAFLSLANAGDLLGNSIDLANNAFKDNTALQIEADKRFETTESKIQAMSNSIFSLKNALYDSFATPVSAVIAKVTEFIGKLAENETFVKLFIPVLLGLGAALVTVKIAIVAANMATKLFTGVVWLANTATYAYILAKNLLTAAFSSNLIQLGLSKVALIAHNVWTGTVTAATWLATTATNAFGIALKIAMGPVGWIILGLTALVGAIVLVVKNWDWIKEKTLAIWNSIKEFFAGVWEGIKEKVSAGIEAVKNAILNPFEFIKSTIMGIWDSIVGTITGAVEKIKNAINWVLDKFRGAKKETSDPFVGPTLPSRGASGGWAGGGIIPSYFASGGVARGTDTVPAMLTPGELILNKAQQKNLSSNMGGVTINISGNFVGNEDEAIRFGNIIAKQLGLSTAIV